LTGREPLKPFLLQSIRTNHNVCNDCSTTLVTNEHVQWADKIYAMEKKHMDYINSLQPENIRHKVTVLQIPDQYKYLNAKLIAILDEKVHF
jgi:predicted protein tyrosine phosphatase